MKSYFAGVPEEVILEDYGVEETDGEILDQYSFNSF